MLPYFKTGDSLQTPLWPLHHEQQQDEQAVQIALYRKYKLTS